MKPDESTTLDFVGIGFQGGVEKAIEAVKRQHPGLDINVSAEALRQEWAEEQPSMASLLEFNRHYDGSFTISHAWAFRVFAHYFLEYMEAVGAENYIKQVIEIVPKVSSGLRTIMIQVSTRAWYVAHKDDKTAVPEENLCQIRGRIKAIEEVVEAALVKASETDGSWRTEEVNWGDLHCAGVEFVVDEFSDGRYVATIEEASPYCPSLCGFVANELNEAGFGDVEVRTEW